MIIISNLILMVQWWLPIFISFVVYLIPMFFLACVPNLIRRLIGVRSIV